MKKTYISNLLMDGDDITNVRKDISQDTWEQGVTLQIANLFVNPPFASSRPIAALLAGSGFQTVVIPTSAADGPSTEPVQGIDWSKRKSNYIDATPQGAEPLKCAAEGNVPGRDQSGQPLWPNRGKQGTGSGSAVAISFTPQDHIATCGLPGGRPDEILLHEMVHALRSAKGKLLCLAVADDFDTAEEFMAILVVNIYRSECGYKTLRANHAGHHPLSPPLDDDRKYYQRYKSWIDLFVSQMTPLCQTLARVSCPFNPLRRAFP